MNENNAKRGEINNGLGLELEAFVAHSGIVDNISTITELKEQASAGVVNIMMGQTFDDGQPVDLVKYAVFMMGVTDILRSGGVKANANWLIADHFITDINGDEEVEKVREQVRKRVEYLGRINDVYGGNIGIVLSSELSKMDSYQQNLTVLSEEGARNEIFREKALEAVPKDRRDNPNAYKYPLEEIATIQSMDTNIKIGPVYERSYDGPAREIAPSVGFNRYVAIQLTRGFLFGEPVVSPDIEAEIEEFGILPYKINSKGMSSYRLDPINDDLERTRDLILSTRDMRAIFDLLAIVDIAKGRLEGSSAPYADQVSLGENLGDDRIKALALDGYLRFVYNHFHSENKVN